MATHLGGRKPLSVGSGKPLRRFGLLHALQGHFPQSFGGMVHVGIRPHLAFMTERPDFLDKDQLVAHRMSQWAGSEIGGRAVDGHYHIKH